MNGPEVIRLDHVSTYLCVLALYVPLTTLLPCWNVCLFHSAVNPSTCPLSLLALTEMAGAVDRRLKRLSASSRATRLKSHARQRGGTRIGRRG